MNVIKKNAEEKLWAHHDNSAEIYFINFQNDYYVAFWHLRLLAVHFNSKTLNYYLPFFDRCDC